MNSEIGELMSGTRYKLILVSVNLCWSVISVFVDLLNVLFKRKKRLVKTPCWFIMQIVPEPMKGLKFWRGKSKFNNKIFSSFAEKMTLATTQRRHSTRYYYQILAWEAYEPSKQRANSTLMSFILQNNVFSTKNGPINVDCHVYEKLTYHGVASTKASYYLIRKWTFG